MIKIVGHSIEKLLIFTLNSADFSLYKDLGKLLSNQKGNRFIIANQNRISTLFLLHQNISLFEVPLKTLIII